MTYYDAFNHMANGNFTGSITTGYVSGAGMGAFFYVVLIMIIATVVQLKTESMEATSLTLMVLAGAGLLVQLPAVSGQTAGINMLAMFGIVMAFGFTMMVFSLLGRRE